MQGCKIEIPTTWNVPLFEELLEDYHDKEIVKYIKYGWPLEVALVTEQQIEFPPNQKEARTNPVKLNQYINEESARGVLLALLWRIRWVLMPVFSPLDAIPKKETTDL